MIAVIRGESIDIISMHPFSLLIKMNNILHIFYLDEVNQLVYLAAIEEVVQLRPQIDYLIDVGWEWEYFFKLFVEVSHEWRLLIHLYLLVDNISVGNSDDIIVVQDFAICQNSPVFCRGQCNWAFLRWKLWA
jgi:hypothetical protein